MWHNQGVSGSWQNRAGQNRARRRDEPHDGDAAPARRERRVAPPLDRAALEALGLRYVERFATTQGKLADYLRRKIRERGWQGEPADVAAIATRFADLGYVDDRGYAEIKTTSLARRGYGERRIAAALHAARVGAADAEAAVEQVRDDALDHALAFARRKRIGPFATAPVDEDQRRRQLAAMLRAGHAFALSARIVRMTDLENVVDD